MNPDFVEWVYRTKNYYGADSLESMQSSSGRMHSRGQSSSSSRSVSSPPGSPCQTQFKQTQQIRGNTGKDSLGGQSNAQVSQPNSPLYLQQPSATRLATQLTRSQFERRQGSGPAGPASSSPLSSYQLSSPVNQWPTYTQPSEAGIQGIQFTVREKEEILARLGGGYGMAEAMGHRLPPLGSPAHNAQHNPSLQGQVQWILGRERAKARPHSPAANAWGRAPVQHKSGNEHAVIGLQGMRLGSSRGTRDRVTAAAGGEGEGGSLKRRMEGASLGQGMHWPEKDLALAVARAAQLSHPQCSKQPPTRTRPVSDYTPLWPNAPTGTSPFYTHVSANSNRPHGAIGSRDRGAGANTGAQVASGGGELEAVIPEAAVGSTSAPVASPRSRVQAALK